MNPHEPTSRLDELAAGRALGNLDAAECRELEALETQPGILRDEDFDLLAASLEVQAALRSARPIPPLLAKRLHAHAAQIFPQPTPQETNILRPSLWDRLIRHPATGWVAAAAVLVMALILPRGQSTASPQQSANELRARSRDLMDLPFSGLGEFSNATGSVIWSNAGQQGFMTLSGIPANNPTKAQYQLWIVDPSRDPDSPVDGGVFDIPAGAGKVVVPIQAKLAVHHPQAFLITLEQPGGVVKSKREKPVALAKL